MSINYFTNEQIEQLRNNPYVKKVSNKSITFEKAFKEYFYLQYSKGIGPHKIFRMAGFDTSILGERRIYSFCLRNKACAERVEGFEDIRKVNSGRPSQKELSLEEKYERLKQKYDILKQENDFLKIVRSLNKKAISQLSKEKIQK